LVDLLSFIRASSVTVTPTSHVRVACTTLCKARGIRCWLDEHELLPGDKIYTEVDRGIRLWDKVLLCCSKEALTSWWVDNEIKIAFDKEQHLWKERGKEVLALIPLNLDNYLLSQWQSGLSTEVKARLAADFSGWESNNEKFEEQFERLVKALRTNSGGKKPPPVCKLQLFNGQAWLRRLRGRLRKSQQ
jgi:hypothetical protein